MKKILNSTFGLALLFSFSACNNNGNQPDVDTSLMNSNSTPAPVSVVDTAAPYTQSTIAPIDGNAPAPVTTQQTPAAPVGAPMNIAPQNNAVAPVSANQASSVKLNPPHGQPGHDCAVEVGAPLTGKSTLPSAQSIPQPTMPSVLTTPQQPLPNANNGSARLNPPHGQPGHDCAVAVGAPLQ